MSKLVARCGLICSECEAYLATVNNDDEARARLAAAWSKEFGEAIEPEKINCLGCQSPETTFGYCQVCAIRACGIEKNVLTCGHCPDYACEKISEFFARAPKVRETLDGIAGKKS